MFHRPIWTALLPGSHPLWVAARYGGHAKEKVMSSSSFAPKPLQVAAAVVGNALEWYDFIVFGFFAVVIGRLFVPTESLYASLLLTTSTFGVGFFMRPVRRHSARHLCRSSGTEGIAVADHRLDDSGHRNDRFCTDLCCHRHCSAHAHCARPLAARVFSRRRIRQCNVISHRNRAREAPWLLWFLANGRPRPGRAHRRVVGRLDHTRAGDRGARQLGLAYPFFCLVSSSDRWDFIFAAASTRLRLFSQHGADRNNKRRLARHSPHMSGRC